MKAKVNKHYELNTPRTSKEDIEKRNKRNKYLESLGVYTSLYTSDSSLNIEYIDGKHNYRQDSIEAIMLVREGQELPQDLLDRLAYYKPIIDKQLEESNG